MHLGLILQILVSFCIFNVVLFWIKTIIVMLPSFHCSRNLKTCFSQVLSHNENTMRLEIGKFAHCAMHVPGIPFCLPIWIGIKVYVRIILNFPDTKGFKFRTYLEPELGKPWRNQSCMGFKKFYSLPESVCLVQKYCLDCNYNTVYSWFSDSTYFEK